MKKAAGYSMLFGAALLCVLLLNADVARSAEESGSEKSEQSSYSWVKTWKQTTSNYETVDGVETLKGKTVKEWSEDGSGNRQMVQIEYDADGNEISRTEPVIKSAEEVKKEIEENGGEDETTKIPQSVGMNLGIKNPGNFPPSNFRGGDPDSGLIHALEDTYYEKHEHTLIYKDDVSELTGKSDAYYATDPNMKWSLTDSDGNVLEEENTNIATNGGTFEVPGEYTIGNSGARQVSTTDQDEKTETSEKKVTTVTSQQTTGVLVHDVTSPDIWVGLAEITGEEKKSVDDLKKELVGNMKEHIVSSEAEQKTKNVQKSMKSEKEEDKDANDAKAQADKEAGLKAEEFKNELEKISMGHQSGRAYSQKEIAAANENEDCWLNNKSFLFIDEGITSKGEDNERNLKPTTKTARVTTTGSLFNEDGGLSYTTFKIKSQLLDEKNYTWLVQVDPSNTSKDNVTVECKNRQDEDGGHLREKMPGVFVKRNVPFYFAAVSTDNGDRRATAKEVELVLYDQSKNEVRKENDGSYMFKTANYPRSEFPEASVYTLFGRSSDTDGNVTEFSMPVYVVDTQANYSIESRQ